jgi:hypothetical protein
VATQSLRQRADLFEQAATFQGKTRERCRAIGFACCEFAIAHPDYFHTDMLLKSSSFVEKASQERREAHAFEGMRCWRAINTIIIEAMALGELPKDRVTAEQATFALVSVTVGSHIMSQEPNLKVFAGIKDQMQAVRLNQDLICDGLGWKPLLHEHDYRATDLRILKEIFPSASKWLKAA